MEAPKAAWLVFLLTTVLIGLKTTSLLEPQSVQWSEAATRCADARWITKFASPAPTPNGPFQDSRVGNLLPRANSAFGLAPKSSPSSLTVVSQAPSNKPAAQPKPSSSKQKLDPAVQRASSVALQASSGSSKKSLTVASSSSIIKTNGCLLASKASGTPTFGFRRGPARRIRRRYSPCSACWSGKMNADMIVFPQPVQSTYLENATTTTWAFWLAELQNYNRLVLKPAFASARQQALEAAQLARRYHQEQVLPAIASLREHAKHTAQQMEDLAARYNQEQVRPAFAFAREQAAHTAQRTAEYREKVLRPAVKQFRHQAMEAAKTTQQGLNKAAKRFSSEAAATVQQVKGATNIDLEAIGIDDYVGFMMDTFSTMKQNLRAEKAQ